MKKFIATALTALMLLSPLAGYSSGSASPNESNQLTNLVTTATVGRDLSTLCILNTSSPLVYRTSTNFYEPLVNLNAGGQYVPGLATSWTESTDGLTWTFQIREDAYWVDYTGSAKSNIVAEDWLWGLEWVMNYHKNSSYNISDPSKSITGALDYYNYTQDLSEEEAMNLDLTVFLEMVL